MDFEEWLRSQKYADNTIASQINRISRIRNAYPNIDEMYEADECRSIMHELYYTKNDERSARPNPTKISISGNIYNNLATYRATLGRYIRFKQSSISEDGSVPHTVVRDAADDVDEGPIGLERDMQRAIRQNISQLEAGLDVNDDGVERRVESGFIDITARDKDGNTVVIELKTGVAGQRAIAQILSYMGDMVEEGESPSIRGILVAFDFDGKAISAAKMVPSLQLVKYRFRFDFEGVAKG